MQPQVRTTKTTRTTRTTKTTRKPRARPWTRVALVLLLAGLALAAQSWAQNPTGTLTGKVTDSDGGALPGVRVTVTSPSLQGTRTAETESNGDYKLAFLPAGTYQVTFELESFAAATQTVKISAAQSTNSDVTLVISQSEVIEVTGNIETISAGRTSATTHSQSEVEKLAVSRNLEEAVLLVPGATETGPARNVTISGAMSFENLFLVNGVVVNENIRGQALDLFIEDAIQETTTTTTGISAEYGRFTGGVVNVLTKSGGNQLSGSLRVNFENDDWKAKTPVSGDRTDKINNILEGTLGGAFVKDRLWFFTAARDRETETTAQTSVTNLTFLQAREQTRTEGKLTLSLTPSHHVIGSYLKIDDLRTNNGFGTFLSLDSLSDREDPQEIKSANYTGILTSNFFIEAQYSERELGIGHGAGGPRDLIAGTLMRNRPNNFRYHAPTFCGECEQEVRNNENLLAKGSYFFSTQGAGTHDIVFGYDTFDDIRFAINHQTGSDFTVWGSNLIIDANKEIYPQFLGPSAWIGWFAVFNLDIAQPTSFKTNSFYVNDSWQLNEHWSFNLGVRYDANDGTNSGGDKVADDHKISPRFGLSYDAKGDGSLVVNASYGTYVAAVANSLADVTSNGGAVGLIRSAYGGPIINPDASCAQTGTCTTTEEALRILFDWYFANGGTRDPEGNLEGIPNILSSCIPGYTAIIPNTLQSPSADEFTVGLSKRLGSRGLFRVDLVHREWTDFYSNRRDLSTGRVDTPTGPADLLLVGNFGNDILEREYSALNTQFRYRLTDRLTFAGNYTLAKLQGNIDGESEVSGPLSLSPREYPEFHDPAWSFPDGYLQADQRHRLRVWAVYDLFENERQSLNVSVLQSFYSGTPYGAVGTVSTAGATDRDGDGRPEMPVVANPGYVRIENDPFTYYYTARDAFKTDSMQRTDFALNYSFRWQAFGKSMEVFLQPEVINVFNNDAVHFIDDINTDVLTQANRGVCAGSPSGRCLGFNPLTQTPIEGVHFTKGGDFGLPENEDAFQDPREYRFSVGFRF